MFRSRKIREGSGMAAVSSLCSPSWPFFAVKHSMDVNDNRHCHKQCKKVVGDGRRTFSKAHVSGT
jgi:hypothetical protein